ADRELEIVAGRAHGNCERNRLLAAALHANLHRLLGRELIAVRGRHAVADRQHLRAGYRTANGRIANGHGFNVRRRSFHEAPGSRGESPSRRRSEGLSTSAKSSAVATAPQSDSEMYSQS